MVQKTILGVFTDRDDAEQAISELAEYGYNAKDISIMMKDAGAAEEIGSNTGANVVGGAVSGATTGGIIGGIAGLLVGIGAIAIPGIGGLLVGGPLAAALGLSGAAASTVTGAATGAVAGGLIGALMGLGIPENEARVYEERINQGAILLAVPVLSRRESEVREILEDNGADQIRTISHQNRLYDDRYDYDDADRPIAPEYSEPHYRPAGMMGGRSERKTKRRVGRR